MRLRGAIRGGPGLTFLLIVATLLLRRDGDRSRRGLYFSAICAERRASSHRLGLQDSMVDLGGRIPIGLASMGTPPPLDCRRCYFDDGFQTSLYQIWPGSAVLLA